MACSQTNFPEMMNRNIPGTNLPASNIKSLSIRNQPSVNLLVQCQQCENAPCVKHVRSVPIITMKTAVRNDPSKCVGCNYCIASCPYDARWSHPDSGLPVKCISEGCMKLIQDGQQPACVQACPAEASCLEMFLIQRVEISQKLLHAVQNCLCLTRHEA